MRKYYPVTSLRYCPFSEEPRSGHEILNEHGIFQTDRWADADFLVASHYPIDRGSRALNLRDLWRDLRYRKPLRVWTAAEPRYCLSGEPWCRRPWPLPPIRFIGVYTGDVLFNNYALSATPFSHRRGPCWTRPTAPKCPTAVAPPS